MSGERLIALRAAAGFTQAEFARRCNLDPAIISRLENGLSSNPTRNTYLKLATALNMDVTDLFKELEPAEPVAA